MKKLNQKEKKNRTIVHNFEDIRIILKSIVKNINLINITRWNAALKLTTLPKKSVKTRLVNRCILTGRKGKFTSSYKFSRLVLLRLIRAGSVSGVTKSAW
jgi:small subunit ribosomal protein S14